MPIGDKIESVPVASSSFDAGELGRRLRAARAKVGLTRRQLADLSGASERYLAQIETGEGNPSLAVLSAIGAALDLAPAELLPNSGEREGQVAEMVAQVRRLSRDRLTELASWLARAPDAGAKAKRIALIGLRGAGKSSLGQTLAKRLDAPFFELSKEVEREYGASIALLIELGGQAALRRHEAEAWNRICAENRRCVVAVPGGIVADGNLFERVLSSAHSIWLQASPADHMRRVIEQGDLRPMNNNRSAMDDLRAILDARSADYGRADAFLNTSAQGFEETSKLLEQSARLLIGEHEL